MDAAVADDADAGAACFADEMTLQTITGRRRPSTPAKLRKMITIERRFYPWRRVVTLDALHLDPDDGAVVWMQIHERSRGWPGLGRVDLRVTQRVRFDRDRDRIVELASFPPL